MGGSVRAALDTSRYLGIHGEEAFIVATSSPSDSHNYLATEYEHVAYRLFRRRFPRHYFRSPSLRRWMRGHVAEFDVVELHGVFSFVPLYAAAACRRSGTPYIVRPHGSLDPFDLQKHPRFKALYGRLVVRRILGGARAIVLTSAPEAARIQTYGSSPERIVIPLPIERATTSGDGVAFRHAHQIPADALVVLFLGRLDHKKGLQFLIPSLSELKASFPNLWFVLAGDGDPAYNAVTTSLLADCRMADWTTRCGFIAGQAKQSAFSASDIFALPSLNENLGIAIVEAMHAGVPVLVSNEVQIHELLSERGAAIVCQPTVPSVTENLRRMLDDDDLRSQLGTRARAAAHDLFGPDQVIPQLVALYQQLRA